MKACWLTAAILVAAVTPVFGQYQQNPIEWSFGAELNLAPSVLNENPRLYDNLNTGVRYTYGFFNLLADLSLRNDLKYSPDEPYWLGRYFYIDQGGILLDFDLISLDFGRLIHRDFLETPYSLFISSEDLPAVQADLTFQAGFFTYESRWFQLNARSLDTVIWPGGYPDRGANYKVFALQFGDIRFGLQDSTVYTDRVFDAEYFFSPVPHLFTQLIRYPGRPSSEDINDNTITGLFIDWTKPSSYIYAQLLVDDLAIDFLVPEFLKDMFGSTDTKFPSKLAWSLGGTYDFAFGTLGFYHAGATKYTFAATEEAPDHPYGYTYYPVVEYALEDGTPMTLDYVDNYIGYKYGENNIAFLVSYTSTFGKVDFGANLEYVISGSKSPANPWHEDTERGDYTLLLDDAVLEHTLAAQVQASFPWRQWDFYSKLRLGGVFNRLELEASGDGGMQIFRPQAGEHRLIYELVLGFSYTFTIGGSKGE